MKANLLLAAAAAMSLGACQTTSAPQSEAEVIFTSHGGTVRARHYRDVAEDCSNRGYASIAIASPPRGGRIELRREGEFPGFPPSNPRSKCNNRKVDGVGVYYVSDPKFIGGDRFTVEVIWADGARWTQDFVVQVR
ncbi:MAG: hypothetical protein BGP06_00870 [Rhizobiales bacterium 65-9]|nr:hypothetical protein [Hyphomicrobiales bacterium]OJY37311.1 MAG: hypothetical protein BGP06_00870 [Rhizobiales bacterium 65-9]